MHKTIILPLVLCGCETRSLTLKEECKLQGTENKALRKKQMDLRKTEQVSDLRYYIGLTNNLVIFTGDLILLRK
jgi:hypothetical protein